jgi:hypothetical protein
MVDLAVIGPMSFAAGVSRVGYGLAAMTELNDKTAATAAQITGERMCILILVRQ